MTRLTIASRPLAASLLVALLGACTSGTASAPGPSGASSSAPGLSAAVSSPSGSGAAESGRPLATPGGQLIPPSASVAPVRGEAPADIMARVRAALAAKAGDAASARATVELAEAVTWPDGSLGCPQPGMFYTQMVVAGYQVVLVLDGTRYDYRIGLGGTPSLCESRLPHAPTPTPAS